MNTFEKARQFIYRNARPLDLARWQYHFEKGSRENVLHALSFYQNPDGGFGHGIEPDFLNPNSTPIAVWAAAEIISEVGLTDKSHPIITGILRYLESGADFDSEQAQWQNTVPTNNDYPHAIWWEHNDGGEYKYNPTAALAAFIIRFADTSSELYGKACEIAEQAVKWFVSAVPFDDQHVTGCFITLYNALAEADISIPDMTLFKEKLCENVKHTICPDTEKWAAEYVTKPSALKVTRGSIFYAENERLAQYECEFIRSS